MCRRTPEPAEKGSQAEEGAPGPRQETGGGKRQALTCLGGSCV